MKELQMTQLKTATKMTTSKTLWSRPKVTKRPSYSKTSKRSKRKHRGRSSWTGQATRWGLVRRRMRHRSRRRTSKKKCPPKKKMNDLNSKRSWWRAPVKTEGDRLISTGIQISKRTSRKTWCISKKLRSHTRLLCRLKIPLVLVATTCRVSLKRPETWLTRVGLPSRAMCLLSAQGISSSRSLTMMNTLMKNSNSSKKADHSLSLTPRLLLISRTTPPKRPDKN